MKSIPVERLVVNGDCTVSTLSPDHFHVHEVVSFCGCIVGLSEAELAWLVVIDDGDCADGCGELQFELPLVFFVGELQVGEYHLELSVWVEVFVVDDRDLYFLLDVPFLEVQSPLPHIVLLPVYRCPVFGSIVHAELHIEVPIPLHINSYITFVLHHRSFFEVEANFDDFLPFNAQVLHWNDFGLLLHGLPFVPCDSLVSLQSVRQVVELSIFEDLLESQLFQFIFVEPLFPFQNRLGIVLILKVGLASRSKTVRASILLIVFFLDPYDVVLCVLLSLFKPVLVLAVRH